MSFTGAYQRIYQFCSVELSSFYLDVLKDRVYAELPDDPQRRAAQFVMARLHDHLSRLLAPIIPHTAEELWDYRPSGSDWPASVHLAEFPQPDPRWDNDERVTALERPARRARAGASGTRGPAEVQAAWHAQQARVRITTNRPERLTPVRELLATLCMVSEIEVVADPAAATESIVAERSPHPKCERCWNYRSTVGLAPDFPTLCDRCTRVLTALRNVFSRSASTAPHS